MTFLKKLNTESPYDPAIPLPGVYPKEQKASTPTGPVHPCSWLNHSQQPKGGNIPGVQSTDE